MEAGSQQAGLDALEQELTALQNVHSAIEDEYSALVDSAPDRLETAVAAKGQALEHLKLSRSRREALLGQMDVREKITGDMRLSSEEQANALAIVDAMNTLGQACQHDNARNGQLIGGLRTMTEGALTILRGEPMVSLYGQSGDRASDLGSRSLGTA